MRRRTGPSVAILVILLMSIACTAWAATDIQFSADQLTSSLAKGKERTVLNGHAFVHTNNTTIHADRIELYGDNFRYAICKGNVDVRDSERKLHLTGDQFFYDRIDEIARMEGNAVMEDAKNEVVVKGGFIESRGKDNVATIEIGVRIFQKDVVTRSEFALFHRDTNTLELSGMPVAYYKGDEYRASRITINLNTDDISLSGEVSGQIVSEEKSKTGENASSSGKTLPPSNGKSPAGPSAPAAGSDKASPPTSGNQTTPNGTAAPGKPTSSSQSTPTTTKEPGQ